MISEIRMRIAVMRLKIMQVFLGLLSGLVAFPITVYAQPEASTHGSANVWRSFVQGLAEHSGGLLIALLAGVLAYRELRAHRIATEKMAKLEEEKHDREQAAAEKKMQFEEKRFESEHAAALKRAALEERRLSVEEEARASVQRFRDEETTRFSQTGDEIAKIVAASLVDHPDWAHRALEGAKLLPYTYTIFGERSQHFQEEKRELAKRFVPLLLKRCQRLAEEGWEVFLLIDAGTTLYAFFEVLGAEAVKACHRGDDWLHRFHLYTNNLPGIEQLIKTGRRVREDRYSGLAIEDCHLLPGVPVPIFAAVAGDETEEAIRQLRMRHNENKESRAKFIALVVGNWIRIRRETPRCPVPMARGQEHLGVKRTLVNNADEIFVVSPLGKIIVNHTRTELNAALGYVGSSRDPESEPYEDVEIDGKASITKLVSTKRASKHLLQRHSNSVEDALAPSSKATIPSDKEFAGARIEELPHLLFDFSELPERPFSEFLVEFPHLHTRRSRAFLEMFSVDADKF
jgi:flagellar motor protein MotB